MALRSLRKNSIWCCFRVAQRFQRCDNRLVSRPALASEADFAQKMLFGSRESRQRLFAGFLAPIPSAPARRHTPAMPRQSAVESAPPDKPAPRAQARRTIAMKPMPTAAVINPPSFMPSNRRLKSAFLLLPQNVRAPTSPLRLNSRRSSSASHSCSRLRSLFGAHPTTTPPPGTKTAQYCQRWAYDSPHRNPVLPHLHEHIRLPTSLFGLRWV